MFKLKFQGGTELARALDELPQAVQGRVLAEALEQAAEPVIAEAERLAPKGKNPREDIGHLATHIDAQSTRTKTHGKTLAVGPDKDHNFYGRFLEFGTRFISARPFLRPAWDANVENVLARLSTALREGITETARRLGAKR